MKREPIDTWEDAHIEGVEHPKCEQFSRQSMNPVVKLNRIDFNDNIATTEPTTNVTLESKSYSTEYWALMKNVAENELKLKLSQCENEEERMDIERQIHRKNMILIDLKIKVQQMQIDALRGQNSFD